ncbi:hypothetical protein LEP1GSC058_2473 [Leptospira fainei serovar Hurstbridge str. BUT 6]|uniref:Uncharacterized protein n=1 Tax=Leptospira fainei serovar Hurstbridge str. BUT 6 TaxID=1193011 RepID=S3VDB3_9LEPT|nr:hypothetical protein [Leptospira fainei]EPG74475.1 hypothetical protein LEP1GSC058_2473 [Leptospira fainei serovar Hurstbridge str. BUT 6]
MRVRSIWIVFLTSLIWLNSCTLEKRISSNPEKRIILASETSVQCKLHSTKSRWAFLGGLIPAWKSPIFFGLIPALNSPIPEPPLGQTIRVTEAARWHDYTVTILLGWLTSLTKRTIIVEFCEENLFVNHWNDREESIDQKMHRMAMTGKVTIQPRNGETFLAKVVGFDSETIFLEVSALDPSGTVVDKAHFKDGSIVEGRAITQNDLEIVMELKDNSRQTYLKSRLKKLELRVPVTILEKKAVPKADILKIMFEELE